MAALETEENGTWEVPNGMVLTFSQQLLLVRDLGVLINAGM
jgi:hypothetical protein